MDGTLPATPRPPSQDFHYGNSQQVRSGLSSLVGESATPMAQFVQGTRLCVEAVGRTLTDPHIQRSLLGVGAIILGLLLVAHLTAFLVLLPFRIIFSIVQLLLLPAGIAWPDSLLVNLSLVPLSWAGSTLDHDTAVSLALNSFVSGFVLSLPFILLTIIRYIWWTPLDNLFRHGLKLWDPELEQNLYTLPPTNFIQNAKECALRTGRRLAMSLVLLLLSLIPVVGVLVFPSAQFYLTYRSLGLPVSATLFLAELLPGINPYSRLVFDHLLNCQGLARELLEPYFTRIRPLPGEKGKLIKKYAPLFYGFFTPFAVCLPIVLLGPIAFAIAQAAVAIILVKEMEKNNDLLETPPKSL